MTKFVLLAELPWKDAAPIAMDMARLREHPMVALSTITEAPRSRLISIQVRSISLPLTAVPSVGESWDAAFLW